MHRKLAQRNQDVPLQRLLACGHRTISLLVGALSARLACRRRRRRRRRSRSRVHDRKCRKVGQRRRTQERLHRVAYACWHLPSPAPRTTYMSDNTAEGRDLQSVALRVWAQASPIAAAVHM